MRCGRWMGRCVFGGMCGSSGCSAGVYSRAPHPFFLFTYHIHVPRYTKHYTRLHF
jgi:hypothetical protein